MAKDYSVYLGEEGPTHQPVEHYWALRLIPNLDFVRPAEQDAGYREAVLPTGVKRVVIEIGRSEPWYGVVDLEGWVIGLDRFGASATDQDIQKHFGFTPDAVADKIQKWLG